MLTAGRFDVDLSAVGGAVSALTLYADGLAALAAVTAFAEYVVAVAVAVALVSLAAFGIAGLVGRWQQNAPPPPCAGVPLVPSARRAPDDLTV
jgi:hypothetical protein